MRPAIRLSITSIFLMTLSLAPEFATHIQAQTLKEEERTVEKLSRKPAPLKIKLIKTKKGEFSLGKKFVAGEDWFKGLSIVLENISGKTITYISAGLLFPRQTKEAGKAPPLYKSFYYGQHPDAPGVPAQSLALRPGDSLTLTLSDADYYKVTANLERLEYTHSIKTIKFNLQEIYFDDGTGWAAGTWFRRNPNQLSIREPQPSYLLDHSLTKYGSDKTFDLLKGSFQETCTVQSEPVHGEIGRCGVYDGFYSRRCCAECCPTYQLLQARGMDSPRLFRRHI
jgi:hypothetical protein